MRALEGAGGEALYAHLDLTRRRMDRGGGDRDRPFWRARHSRQQCGIFLGMSIEEATLADWHRLCAVNLTGVFLGTKLALPALRESA